MSKLHNFRTPWTALIPSCLGRAGLLVTLMGCCSMAWAQCDREVVLTSSKTEYQNAAGVVERSVEERCVITVGKTGISIAPADHEPMLATVVSTVCEWEEAFKTGRTTVQATFQERDGKAGDATITIEGKDGKITCTMTQKSRPDRVILVVADTFGEKTAAPKR
ncbi:MAG: hypothetical protein J0L84_16685 [Verrucomicrobia bacterium]|nr:hypothetical protein [Verrucomicrobiota bacterium]